MLICPCLSHRAFFNALFVMFALKNALDKDRRSMNMVRIEFAGLDKVLHFRNVMRPAVAIIGLKLRAVFR